MPFHRHIHIRLELQKEHAETWCKHIQNKRIFKIYFKKKKHLFSSPQHHVEPQQSEAPYKFLLNEHQYKAGQSVNFKIKGNGAGDTIKGFLIQARIGDKPVGKFEISPKSKKFSQLLNCSGGSGVSRKNTSFFMHIL